jgi:hypothetical protein
LIEVEQATQIAEALGLRRKGTVKRRRKNGRSCEDCFFHRQMLCALDLDAPCSTFRPDTGHGLVPPRQPILLVRDSPGDETATDPAQGTISTPSQAESSSRAGAIAS